jgi:hypothetical protein
MRYELPSTLNAAEMHRFERVVALPDPKKCLLPSRINSLEAQTNLLNDPEGQDATTRPERFQSLIVRLILKIRADVSPDKP